MLVSYLATELAYETNVEYMVNSHAVQHVKAYYAARSGLELSLLRIKIYNQVMAQLPPQAKKAIKPELLEMIWKMPFSWPPTFPEALNAVDTDLIKDKIKASTMDASYMTSISDEGSKIDLNGLNAPTQAMRDVTHKQLLRIFEDRNRDDEKWAKAHGDLRPDEIINNIQDWISAGRVSANGGDKSARYASLGQGYPPNRAFRTVDEMRLVPGVSEDVFELLRDQVTVFGMGAINPNHATKEILMSIDPSITSKIADELIQRRDDVNKGGQYKDSKDFWQYVAGLGARVDPNTEQALPIICDSVFNFRIKATGSYKNSTSEITAIIYDLQKSAAQMSTALSNSLSNGSTSAATPPPGGGNNNNSSSKGPPRIVYWSER